MSGIINSEGSPGPSVYAGSTTATVPGVQGISWTGQLTGSTPLGPPAGLPLLGSGDGVAGASGSGTGVVGSSDSGVGVTATSQTGVALQASSGGDVDTILATSKSPNHAAVSALNTGGGKAVFAMCTGPKPSSGGMAGYFSSDGEGDAVLVESSSSLHAAVSAQNSNGGFGVWAQSQTGVALQASSGGDVDTILATSKSPKHAAVSALNGNTIGGFGVWATGNVGGHFESNADNDAIQGVTHSEHAGVSGYNSGKGKGLWGKSENGIGIYATGGTYAALFDGTVQHNGDHHCTGKITADTMTAKTDVVLGSDCAEDFDVSQPEEVEPGTVMVLGENGAVELSQNAYDKKVAGVISGAGDYKLGLILGRGNSSQRRMPLALLGKVFCKADAQYGAIEVGDLLTTSPSPGHAMRAADPLKAFGAVIGKALRPLSSGRGLVPILIALQ